MDRLIFPGIFDSDVNPVRKPGQGFFSNGVKAFFTKKSLGIDIKKICTIFSIEKKNVYLPIQRHGDRVIVIDSDLHPEIADGVLTHRKGIVIGVQGADCVPILCFDRKKYMVGAVHAGWRGTANQILKKALIMMFEHFHSSAEDIMIAFGPSIRWSCYPVGDEVKDAISRATGEGDYYLRINDTFCIDLSSANKYQALSMGVPEKNIWISPECTYCNPREFHSYRYTKNTRGRQGGFIGILDEKIHEQRP